MQSDNPKEPVQLDPSTAWALTAILRQTRIYNKKFSPAQIDGKVIREETIRNHSGGSPLFASQVMRMVHAAAGRETTSQRQPKLDPRHQKRKEYHTDAHKVLLPALTQLVHEAVDGVNAQTKTYTNKFFIEHAAPVPERAIDDHASTLMIKTHPKDAQFLITQGIASFTFKSKYDENPEQRSASVNLQSQKSELDIKPGDGFYPPAKLTPLTSKPIWKSGESLEEADLARVLNSARKAMLAFMEKFNPDAVAAYKKTLEAARPEDAKPKAAIVKEEPVLV